MVNIEVGQVWKSRYSFYHEGHLTNYYIRIEEIDGEKIKCVFKSLYGDYWLKDTSVTSIDKLMDTYEIT